MATNIDVTLKRYNGTDYDLILPTTHLGQLFTDNTLTVTLSDYLDARYINLDEIGAVGGLATLDSAGKLTLSQLPDVALDSLMFGGVVSANGTNQEIVDKIHQAIYQGKTIYNSANQVQRSAVGIYLSVVAEGEINNITTAVEGVYLGYETEAPPAYYKVYFEQQDGKAQLSAPSSSGVLEVGDWIVITNAYGAGTQADPIVITFAPVNNAYEVATTEAHGITRLTDITSLASASGNDVVTEGILAGLVETEEADMSGTDGAFTGIGANLIAPARHKHDSRYYTETEINNWILGTQTISSNTYVPIIYGADPTSDITGAILIDID